MFGDMMGTAAPNGPVNCFMCSKPPVQDQNILVKLDILGSSWILQYLTYSSFSLEQLISYLGDVDES